MVYRERQNESDMVLRQDAPNRVCLNADMTKVVDCDSEEAAFAGYTKDEAERTIRDRQEDSRDVVSGEADAGGVAMSRDAEPARAAKKGRG